MTALHVRHLRERPAARTARLSLELAAASAALMVALVVLSLWDARDTGWGSWVVPITAVAAFAAGIGGGAAAIVALAGGERRKAFAFPGAVGLISVFAILGEIFIWE